jgi:hypothetical protein
MKTININEYEVKLFIALFLADSNPLKTKA